MTVTKEQDSSIPLYEKALETVKKIGAYTTVGTYLAISTLTGMGGQPAQAFSLEDHYQKFAVESYVETNIDEEEYQEAYRDFAKIMLEGQRFEDEEEITEEYVEKSYELMDKNEEIGENAFSKIYSHLSNSGYFEENLSRFKINNKGDLILFNYVNNVEVEEAPKSIERFDEETIEKLEKTGIINIQKTERDYIVEEGEGYKIDLDKFVKDAEINRIKNGADYSQAYEFKRGDISKRFINRGIYKGHMFGVAIDEYRNETFELEESVLTSLPYLEPGNDRKTGYVALRLDEEGSNVEAKFFIDQEIFKKYSDNLKIAYGMEKDPEIKLFDFKEVKPGVYMDSIMDDNISIFDEETEEPIIYGLGDFHISDFEYFDVRDFEMMLYIY